MRNIRDQAHKKQRIAIDIRLDQYYLLNKMEIGVIFFSIKGIEANQYFVSGGYFVLNHIVYSLFIYLIRSLQIIGMHIVIGKCGAVLLGKVSGIITQQTRFIRHV